MLFQVLMIFLGFYEQRMRICVALFWSFISLNLPNIMCYQVNTGLKIIEDYSVVLSCSSVHADECVMGY